MRPLHRAHGLAPLRMIPATSQLLLSGFLGLFGLRIAPSAGLISAPMELSLG
jgi:hypothetical protein